eukprot:scaffold38043_cov176-Amphora_coffeaeformis.AAC.1
MAVKQRMPRYQKAITLAGLFLALPYVLDVRQLTKQMQLAKQEYAHGLEHTQTISYNAAMQNSTFADTATTTTNSTMDSNTTTATTGDGGSTLRHSADTAGNASTSPKEDDDDNSNNNITSDIAPSANNSLLQQFPHIVNSFHNSSQRVVSHLNDETKAAIRSRLQGDPAWSLLPPWAQDYFTWHAEMRTQYPDTDILTHPDAPGVVITICSGHCGGTHDRLGKVENALAFAALSNRIVMWKWHLPAALEAFLEPNLCNWTAPLVQEFEQEYLQQHPTPDLRSYVGNIKNLPLHQVIKGRPVDRHKIVYLFRNIPNGNAIPAPGLKLNQKSVLGAVFRSLFRPSAAVHAMLNQVYRELDISPGNYTAAHCRVRHPGFYGQKVPGKEDGLDADASGLVFEGEWKNKATEAALMGVQCSARLLSNPQEPIYFMSDADELVQYVVHGKGRSHNETAVDIAMTEATRVTRVVARNVTGTPTIHIDRQEGFPLVSYMQTFVDLYLAVNARCVSFGVGNFGYFASKISGTSCTQVHNVMPNLKEKRKWNQQNGGAPVCKL